jgi:23S rRNA (adenine2503-C2)-methyltransferase
MSDLWKNVQVLRDEAGHVAKYVFTNDTAACEAVLYRYPSYRTRTVICCSTQSGCPIGCRFCGSGDNFNRSLTSEEITSQIERCLADIDCEPLQIEKFQIMFMSMGEPMLNQRQTFAAIRALHQKYPTAALLISTSAPRVDFARLIELSQEIDQVGLQFSVHETTDVRRNALIPFPAKLTIAQIAATGARWRHAVGRAPFFNYCAHEGNSSSQDADRLRAIFDPSVWQATVSVICERSEGLAETNAHQRGLAQDFSSLLLERGFDVRTFDPAGQDTIGGGCGQLHFVQAWFAQHPELVSPSAGRNLRVVHAPR